MSQSVSLRTLYIRYKLWVWLGLGLLLVGLVWRGCRADKQWQHIKPFGIRMPLKYDVHGIDVSHHNRRIDWKRVSQMQAGGIRLQFAFIKATEGATHIDRQFARNWREAKAAGLLRGAYHFYHPRRDPKRQADNFIRQVKLQRGDLAPVLDFEIDRGIPAEELIDGLRIWLTQVEAHYDIRPIIYVNANFYKRYIAGNFDDYPLWIADYSNTQLTRYDTDKLVLWQHNKNGYVNGIQGFVDFNVFVPDPDELKKICL
ncbi:glycoside hydrolase family 25 protein [Nibrella saemangeumensis]|uniref:Glycoside hydrolase family 25 protein n=1 Tax=Nibrella saemangeumensis TaxID=1084526 RepID=A0ABP8NLC5_9BACT